MPHDHRSRLLSTVRNQPETFFLVLGMPADSATDMAAHYQYEALEFKATAHRADGVFQPREAGLPLYFLEVQFYHLPSVFADLLVKAYTYLKQHDPGQAYCGVVLFGSRAFEPAERMPYQPLLDAGLIRCFYLDEMPEVANAPLGLSILYLIRQSESQAPATARALVAHTKAEIGDEALRADLIQLIETVILYKLPRLSREEIQAMLQVHDIRETRVYQEALQEGIEERAAAEGLAQEEKLRTIPKMAARKMNPRTSPTVLGVGPGTRLPGVGQDPGLIRADRPRQSRQTLEGKQATGYGERVRVTSRPSSPKEKEVPSLPSSEVRRLAWCSGPLATAESRPPRTFSSLPDFLKAAAGMLQAKDRPLGQQVQQG